jgi:hypothetical protein
MSTCSWFHFCEGGLISPQNEIGNTSHFERNYVKGFLFSEVLTKVKPRTCGHYRYFTRPSNVGLANINGSRRPRTKSIMKHRESGDGRMRHISQLLTCLSRVRQRVILFYQPLSMGSIELPLRAFQPSGRFRNVRLVIRSDAILPPGERHIAPRP